MCVYPCYHMAKRPGAENCAEGVTCLGTEDMDGGGKLRTHQRHGRSLGSPTDALQRRGAAVVWVENNT